MGKRMKKRGASTIIVTVILIVIVLILAGIVFSISRKTIFDKMKYSKSCPGIFDGVFLNDEYTCWDSNANRLQFSVGLSEVDVDGVIIGISGAKSKKFSITSTDTPVSNVADYGSTAFGTDPISLPAKNGGKTYVTNYTAVRPDTITIAPIIDEHECGASDEIKQIGNCQ